MTNNLLMVIEQIAVIGLTVAGLLMMLGARRFAAKLAIASIFLVVSLPFAVEYALQFSSTNNINATKSAFLNAGAMIPEPAYGFLAIATIIAGVFGFRMIASTIGSALLFHWIVTPILSPILTQLPLPVTVIMSILSLFAMYFLLIKILFGRRVYEHVAGAMIATYTIRLIDGMVWLVTRHPVPLAAGVAAIGIGTWAALNLNGATPSAPLPSSLDRTDAYHASLRDSISSMRSTAKPQPPVTSTVPASSQETASRVTTAKRANVRASPNQNDDNILGTLEAGQIVIIIGPQENGWYPIRYEGGHAFIHNSVTFAANEK
jgi:hypothetical protein